LKERFKLKVVGEGSQVQFLTHCDISSKKNVVLAKQHHFNKKGKFVKNKLFFKKQYSLAIAPR
jgi:hypothetical protein